MGRPDIAQRDDREILAAHPNDSGARSFASDIADALNPALRVSESVGTQSDNLLIRTANFETEVHSAQGLTSFLFDYQPISYVAPNTDYATERRLGVGVRQRFNDWSEINANVANDGISAMGISDKSLFLYNTYLTLWPNDTFRFDIGSHRDTFDNLTSLREGITAVFDSFSMDVLPDEISRLTLRADRGQFSDGNERAWQQVEFERAFVRQPRILFGAQYTNYTFTQSLYNGYFDPPHYRSAEVTTHIYGDSRKRLYYDLSGSYGREWVEAGGDRPTHSLNGSLSYVLSRPLSISAFYNSFDTRQFSNGGFARTVVGLRLQTKW
jgi:hypothetical protein